MNGIDPMLPVNMSGTIMLNSSELSTWMPALAAFLTVLATLVIVALTNHLSFKKTARLLEQNKEIEMMRISAREEADWEVALNRAISEFIGNVTLYACLSADWLATKKENPKFESDKDVVLAYQVDDRMVRKSIAQSCTTIRNLLSLGIEEHKELFDFVVKIQKRVYGSRELGNAHALELKFYDIVERALKKGKSTNRIVPPVLTPTPKKD